MDNSKSVFQEKLKSFSRALKSSGSYQKDDDWMEGLDDTDRAIARPIFRNWLPPLIKQIEKMPPDPTLLENLWILEHLATRFSVTESRSIIHKALVEKWRLTPSDDANHWMMGLGFLNAAKLETARRILAEIKDKNTLEAAKCLLAIHDPSTSLKDFSKSILSIPKLSSNHKSSLFQQLFARVSHEKFAKSFLAFSRIFDWALKSENDHFPVLLDWVETAWRLGFASEAVPRLMRLDHGFPKLAQSGQIAQGAPLISLWMRMGYENKARRNFLALTRLRPQDPELESRLLETISEIQENYPELLPGGMIEGRN